VCSVNTIGYAKIDRDSRTHVLMPLASMASRTPIIVRRDFVWGNVVVPMDAVTECVGVFISLFLFESKPDDVASGIKSAPLG
jgi:hypothetical protein